MILCYKIEILLSIQILIDFTFLLLYCVLDISN